MDAILKEFQHLKIQLEAIKSATSNFDNGKLIGKGGFGKVYEGVLSHSYGEEMLAFKRLDRNYGQGDPEFLKEILMLSHYTHENLISLLGFCNEDDEKILVYQHASHGSLDRHLSATTLTWRQRLKICLEAATGLCYLHDPMESQQRVLHRDIKSSNILLDENWKAKVSDMGLSKLGPANQQHTILVSNVVGTLGYIDPIYMETGILTKESDVYSFGVVLFEVLCGRLCFEYDNGQFQSLVWMWKKNYKQKKLDEIIFQHLKQQMDPRSLEAFSDIAYRCLQSSREERPKMSTVVERLEIALRFQEIFEEVEPPMDYEEISKIAKPPLVYSSKEELKMHLSKGIFVDDGDTWFLLNNNGEHCEMISASKCLEVIRYPLGSEVIHLPLIDSNYPLNSVYPFDSVYPLDSEVNSYPSDSGGSWWDFLSYIIPKRAYCDRNESRSQVDYYGQYVSVERPTIDQYSTKKSKFTRKIESRFLLEFKTHVRAQFLSPHTTYTVNLVFHLDPRHVFGYVSLNYTLAGETKYSTSYYAHEREDGWLMAELYQFTSTTTNIDLEITFESPHPIAVEGIEFQPVERVEDEEVDTQHISDSYADLEPKLPLDWEAIVEWSKDIVEWTTAEELYSILCKGLLTNIEGKECFSFLKNGKNCHMLPARLALVEEEWNWRSSTESRFEEVAFDPVADYFWVNWRAPMLSPETTYGCYLVYKLQNNHSGFETRVEVSYDRSCTTIWYIYFLSPQTPVINRKAYQNSHNPLNRANKLEGLPHKRNDGWMEVQLYDFQSGDWASQYYPNKEFILTFYTTPSFGLKGLIIQGVECKPM